MLLDIIEMFGTVLTFLMFLPNFIIKELKLLDGDEGRENLVSLIMKLIIIREDIVYYIYNNLFSGHSTGN